MLQFASNCNKKHHYYTIVPLCYSLHGSIDKSCHFRFAKNLSHDQIHLSTLKGEGELKNLELNEEVLTELLELPSWLRLSGATCNRVSVRIQWTKLKSVPIQLSLDEVRVEVETCENLRQMSNSNSKNSMAASYASGGQYGFADKVLDGITLTVNSVILTLKSHAFIASFQVRS